MNYFRKCCSRIIRQVRISRKAKRHVIRRHFLPKATGRVSVFSHKLSPNDVFEITLNKLRSGQLQGKIHYNCLRYRILFHSIVGVSVDGSPSKCIRVFQLLENVRMPIAKELYPKKSKQYILFKAEFVISHRQRKSSEILNYRVMTELLSSFEQFYGNQLLSRTEVPSVVVLAAMIVT